ncbi:MAG: hypothetical protein JNJ50_24085 [Acidobacteria bacterium]|nr:hypothetical protein [Acidobacteriota bacterium]
MKHFGNLPLRNALLICSRRNLRLLCKLSMSVMLLGANEGGACSRWSSSFQEANTTSTMFQQGKTPAPGSWCIEDKSKRELLSVDYRIICIWPAGDIKPARMIFGYISPKNLNRDDILKLANELNRRFSKYRVVKVIFWDNEKDANYFGKGRLDDYSGFGKSLRLTYVKDQKQGEEFVEYILDPNKPEDKVKIVISARR